MSEREKDKETLRIDRTGEDPDKTAPAARPVKPDSASDDVTAPAAQPVVAAGSSSEDETAPAARPLKLESASEKPAAAARTARASTWRRTLLWVAMILVGLWTLFVLPAFLRQLKSRAVASDSDAPVVEPVEDAELPPDPPLSAEVQELMRRGRAAEDVMQLADARKLYGRAAKQEPRCSSCQLRLAVVERRIEAFGFQALDDGNRYLADGRYEEAAKSYQKVLDLVPHEEARFHILAKAGLEDARKAAKEAGRPIP